MAPGFKIQISDTVGPVRTCSKCANDIITIDDPEYVSLWPANSSSWAFHINCFEDVFAGLVEFYKTFILKKKKKKERPH